MAAVPRIGSHCSSLRWLRMCSRVHMNSRGRAAPPHKAGIGALTVKRRIRALGEVVAANHKGRRGLNLWNRSNQLPCDRAPRARPDKGS